VLDERGKALASEAFAELLRRHIDGGTQDMAFLIGGPTAMRRNSARRQDC
jgi:23S rRNA pseudoU1915 N3-methylase RlmH